MFKVGDKVVTTNESQLRHIEDVGRVSGINAFGYLFINDSKAVGFNPESFRHATDQEIKVGHRIDHFRDGKEKVNSND